MPLAAAACAAPASANPSLTYVNGVWVEVEVVEARADHVVLNLKSSGPVALVALP